MQEDEGTDWSAQKEPGSVWPTPLPASPTPPPPSPMSGSSSSSGGGRKTTRRKASKYPCVPKPAIHRYGGRWHGGHFLGAD